MATRSLIMYKNDKKEYEYVYCHWDGYPDGVGATLVESYDTEEKVKELLSFGDISSLRDNICPKGEHTFDNPEKEVTVFYGRDREEKGVDMKISKTLPKNNAYGTEYRYLFVDGKWKMSDKDGGLKTFVDLKEYLGVEDIIEGAFWKITTANIHKDKINLLKNLSKEKDNEVIKDMFRYVIEHYLTNEQVKEIINELYEGV